MGTHGAKGMQRLVGSYALKVITHSVTPFVVVQEKGPSEGGYDDIIMPLDINKKTKQKLKYAAEVASYFNAKVHIFIQNDNDKDVMNEIKRNLVFARNYFTEKGVSFATFVSEGDGAFQDELITYSASINADIPTFQLPISGTEIFNGESQFDAKGHFFNVRGYEDV